MQLLDAFQPQQLLLFDVELLARKYSTTLLRNIFPGNGYFDGETCAMTQSHLHAQYESAGNEYHKKFQVEVSNLIHEYSNLYSACTC
jgi:hypothetical protein